MQQDRTPFGGVLLTAKNWKLSIIIMDDKAHDVFEIGAEELSITEISVIFAYIINAFGDKFAFSSYSYPSISCFDVRMMVANTDDLEHIKTILNILF